MTVHGRSVTARGCIVTAHGRSVAPHGRSATAHGPSIAQNGRNLAKRGRVVEVGRRAGRLKVERIRRGASALAFHRARNRKKHNELRMGAYPTTPRAAFLEWCQAHTSVFTTNATQIGLTAGQATAFANATTAAAAAPASADTSRFRRANGPARCHCS